MGRQGPESRLQRRVMDRLNREPGVFAIKLHGSIFSRAGLPDLLVLAKIIRLDDEGKPRLTGATKETAVFERATDAPIAVFIELKAPNGKAPTAIQLATHAKLAAVGFPVTVCRTYDQVVTTLFNAGVLPEAK